MGGSVASPSEEREEGGLRVLGILAAAALLTLLLVWIFQRRLIYFPAGEVPPAASVLPGAAEVSFRTGDGLELGGWFVRGRGEAARGTVLVFNGNAGNRSFRAPLADALSRVGVSVLLFDYRGYGGNPGCPTQEGLYADARAARAYLDSRSDVDPQRIAYFGESLGAAVAVAAAAERPPAALVLRSPFRSLVAVGRFHYPFLPVRFLLKDRFPAAEQVRGITCPLLVLVGDRDRIVPAAQSRTLFDAAPQGSKRFVVVSGADHNDFDLVAGDPLLEEVVPFLQEAFGRGPA